MKNFLKRLLSVITIGSLFIPFSVALGAVNIVPNGGTGVGTITGIIKGNGTSPFTAAVSGTDYLPITGGTGITTLGTITTGTWNGTAIANANLANSTISGISLGSNLNALTATNTSLTFSGSYNGSTARTIGLNLANANTWTGQQTFNTTAPIFGTITGSTQCLHVDTNGLLSGTGSDCGSGSGGATTALDNLASVAINTSLISDTDVTDDLGSTLKKWNNIYGAHLGATATRFTDGFFTDLAVTNAISGSITGNAATVTIADAGGDTTTFPLLGTSATGSLAPATDAGLSFNATTNALTATTFIGALSGNSTTATALATGRTISISGDLTYSSPSFDGSGNVTAAGTLATVNSNVGSFGSATAAGTFTVNGKGLITAASSTTITPAVGSITGLGSGVGTWLATPSSANLITAVTDETGSGALVFGTTPTIATPVLNGTPTGTGVATAATVSTLALRDSNGNLTADNWLGGYTTTATAAGTTTLTVDSTYLQYFTGSTTQTVTLPVVSTLALGTQYIIVNNSTGAVTVNSSGGNAVIILAGSTSAVVTSIATSGTTASVWSQSYAADNVTSGKKLSVSNTLTIAGTDGTTMTFPTTSATIARTDAANTFTGHQTIEGVTSTGATGSGKFVFDTSPTLVTPALGAATYTTLSGGSITDSGLTSTRVTFSGASGLLSDDAGFLFTAASDLLTLGEAGTDGSLKIFSEDGATDHSTIFNPGTQTQDITYTLPVNDGNANQVLTTDGAGVLSWAAPASTAVVELIPQPGFPSGAVSSKQLNVNTTAAVGKVYFPAPITTQKISINIIGHATNGTIKIALFSEDGQTQIFSVTTASITTTGIVSTAISSTLINPGYYYIVMLPVSTTDTSPVTYTFISNTSVLNGVASEPALSGTITVTAGTMPATITPTSITADSTSTLAFRLDN